MKDCKILKAAIIEAAETNLKNLVCMPNNSLCALGGVNGPYFDIETPVRNTAHWCITYAILGSEMGNMSFLKAANKLLDFLIQPGPYEQESVYIHRQKQGKDWSNGDIGQAWVIEALTIAGKKLLRSDSLSRAKNISMKFPFDYSLSAWQRIDPRNQTKAIDYTLNH
jgi:hypothetical protein